jgi:DNA-binding MarR family transcriptional regulator
MLSRRHHPAMNAAEALTDLIVETFRLNGRLLTAGDDLVRDLGLTSARWQVLGAAAMSPTPLPVAHLARNMGVTRQAVQRIANELSREGVVEFATNPHHRRAQLVVLTERGRSLWEEAMRRQGPWARSLAKGVSARDLSAAAELLRLLRDRLESSTDLEK